MNLYVSPCTCAVNMYILNIHIIYTLFSFQPIRIHQIFPQFFHISSNDVSIHRSKYNFSINY